MLRKILSFIICIALSLSVFSASFTVSAAEDCTVSVETVTAKTGEIAFVRLYIDNNPGIMAMTISITYDSSALEFANYYYGNVFNDYTVAAHPTRNIIRLVICERKDRTDDGRIITIKFNVAENAEYGLHEMTVDYSAGDFCNYNLERIMPKIVSGGVNVEYNGNNCSHKSFGEWEEKIAPSCKKEGVDQRACKKCGYLEYRSSDPVGHEFSDKWTVDIPATADSAGTMSRHCIRCDATTDETTFTIEQTDKGSIDNTVDAVVPENDVIKEIIKEQHPDIDDPYSNPNGEKDENNGLSQSGDTDETQEQIENFIGILSHDDEDSAESAMSVSEKLREAIPKIDKLLYGFKIALIALIVIILH